MVWSTNVDPLPVRKSSTDAGLQGHEGVVRGKNKEWRRGPSAETTKRFWRYGKTAKHILSLLHSRKERPVRWFWVGI